MWLWVWVWMWVSFSLSECVLRRFQQSFSHIMTVAACCGKRDGARVLSAANTGAQWGRHEPRVHQPVTLSGQQANQPWCYPLNTALLARKQPGLFLTPLGGCGCGIEPPDLERNALTIRPAQLSQVK